MPEDSASLLKVFSGPHVGAEILLADGEYLIGSDEGCDVIFSDRFIAPRHAKLTIQGPAVRCAAVDGAGVFVNGERVREDGRDIAAFEYFTLGNTHLAVGPSDAPWPVIEFPDYQLNSAPPPAAPAEEPQPEATAEPAPEQLPASTPAPVEEPRPRRRRRGLVVLVLLLLFVPMLWGASVRWGRPSAEPEVPVSLEDQLQAAVAPYTEKGARLLVTNKDGRLHVDGYVATLAERHKLTSTVQHLSPTIRCRVFDTQSLARAVQQVLRGTEMPFLAKPGQPGEVIVLGKGTDKVRWQWVQQRIHEDVRTIAKLTDQVKFETARPVAMANVEPVKPVEAPVVPPEDNGPEENPSEPPPAVEEVAVAAPVPEATVEAPTTEEASPLPSLEYVSVSIGANASVTLPGGERLFVGAPVGGGYRITSITPRAVVLVRGEEQLVLPLGGAK